MEAVIIQWLKKHSGLEEVGTVHSDPLLSPLAGSYGSQRGAGAHGGGRTEGECEDSHPPAHPSCSVSPLTVPSAPQGQPGLPGPPGLPVSIHLGGGTASPCSQQ